MKTPSIVAQNHDRGCLISQLQLNNLPIKSFFLLEKLNDFVLLYLNYPFYIVS